MPETMSKRLRFEGHSDDTFGFFEDDSYKDDHDDCANMSVRTFLVDAGADGRICVTGVYGKGCMWSIGIALCEEGDALPGWAVPMYSVAENGYSLSLCLDVPIWTEVTLVHPRIERDRD